MLPFDDVIMDYELSVRGLWPLGGNTRVFFLPVSLDRYTGKAFPQGMMTSSNGPGEFPAQWSVTRSFDVFFDLRLNNG